MLKHKTNKKRGFTLVEIIVVVIIIAILAAVVVPRFVDASARAKDSAALAELRTILSAVTQAQMNSATNEVPTEGSWQADIDKYLADKSVVPAKGAKAQGGTKAGLTYNEVNVANILLVIKTKFAGEDPDNKSATAQRNNVRTTKISKDGTITVENSHE